MAYIAADITSGNDANGGTNWGDAVQNFPAARALASAGDIIVLRNSGGGGYAWSQAGAYAVAGSVNEGDAPIRVIAVKSGTTAWPPGGSDVVTNRSHSDVASLTVSGNNDMTLRGMLYSFGVEYSCGGNVKIADTLASALHLEEGKLTYGTVATSPRGVLVGSSTSVGGEMHAILQNIDILPSATNDYTFLLYRSGRVDWAGGSILTTSPASIIEVVEGGIARINSCDLSICSGDGVGVTSAEGGYDVVFDNCKLHASLSKVSSTVLNMRGGRVAYHNCSSSNVKNDNYMWEHETSVITDTGVYLNATFDSQGFSTRIQTSSTCTWGKHFRVPLGMIVIDLSTSKTITVEFVRDNASGLDNSQIWLEGEYADDTTCLGFLESNRVANFLTTGTAHTTSTASWTGTGGFGSVNKQKMSLTPSNTGKKAIMYLYACVAAASEDVYIDGKFTVA